MIRAVALFLTVLTGFTALVYQVAWQRFLAALLGSHSEATAVVLAIFLGGLSLGYGLFGKLSRRWGRAGGRSRLIAIYGGVEAAIGVWALLFPWLFRLARSASVGLSASSDIVAFAADVLLTALLIGTPAVLMGATIPLLTQALARDLADATRLHSLVYASNTAGAVAGALAAGFVLVPRLGLRGAVWSMAALNLAAGLAFLGLARRQPADAGPGTSDDATPAPAAFPAWVAVAACSGFALMTLQTTVNRLAAFSMGSSPFTFAMVVALFVLGIATGSFAVSSLRRVPRWLLPASQWTLAAGFLALYLAVPDAPYWAYVIRASFRSDPTSFYPYHGAIFLALGAVLIVPLALSGATLPLLFDRLRRDAGRLGRLAGRLYAWNTVGSLLGALLGGYLLLLWLDLSQIYRLAVLVLLAGATLVTWLGAPRRRALVLAPALAGAVVLALAPAWDANRLTAGLFRSRGPLSRSFAGPDDFYAEYLQSAEGLPRVAFYEDGPVASIAVVQSRGSDGVVRSILTNGKSDSAIPTDDLTTGMLALLPALLARDCERAFVIGLGTGYTAGGLASLESIREVRVAEIARGVIDAAPIFETDNGGAATHPKTRIVRGDAYRVLRRSEGRFDVITSEPSNPWVAGIELLYSREFFETVRAKLAPGGVFVQWLHTYEIDEPTLALALNTFRSVFPDSAVWYGKGVDLLFVGFQDEAPLPDLDRMRRRWARADFRRAFGRFGIESFAQLLAHEWLPLGVVRKMELPSEVHTILRPTLNDRAARAFFVGAQATLPPSYTSAAASAGARQSLIRRYRAAQGGRLSVADRRAILWETCRELPGLCPTLFAQWQHEEPDSPELADNLELARRQFAAADLSFNTLFRLTTLFDERLTAVLPGEFDFARRVYESFTQRYHHAAPFDAGALHGPWTRCADDPRCAAELPRIRDIGVDLPLAPAP